MKAIAVTVVLVVLASFVVTSVWASESKTEPVKQTTCPVMGGAINKEIFADHDGKRVYFCCAGCVEAFKKDPETYIKKLEADGAVLEDVPEEAEPAEAKEQTTCPIMGGAINKKYYANHNGKRVYFCCPGCVGPFRKEPDKYIKQLEDDGVVLGEGPDEAAVSNPQTTCPVMRGKAINKRIFADHDGKRVYFCCRSCVRRFKRTPDKYIKQLEDQGITLETVPDAE